MLKKSKRISNGDGMKESNGAAAILRLSARRIAIIFASLVAAIALVASLATAPGQSEAAPADSDTTEQIAGPSWSGPSAYFGGGDGGGFGDGMSARGPSWS